MKIKLSIIANACLFIFYISFYLISNVFAHHAPTTMSPPTPNCQYSEYYATTSMHSDYTPVPDVYVDYYRKPHPCGSAENHVEDVKKEVTKCVLWGHTKDTQTSTSAGLSVGNDATGKLGINWASLEDNGWQYSVSYTLKSESTFYANIPPGYECWVEWRYTKKSGRSHRHEYLAWSCYALYLSPYYCSSQYASGVIDPFRADAWGETAQNFQYYEKFPTGIGDGVTAYRALDCD